MNYLYVGLGSFAAGGIVVHLYYAPVVAKLKAVIAAGKTAAINDLNKL